jgi:protoheme IX farnesyltransferase
VAATLALPWLSRGFGWWFLAAAVLLGVLFLTKAWRLWRARPRPEPRALFRYSLLYIAGLFGALILDAWSGW